MAVHPSAALITTIDIDRPARTLAVLRWSDAVLVLGCGFGALAILPDLVLKLVSAQWLDLVVQGAMAATLAFAAYTGWRHVGVIDPRVWGSYLWVFPLLATFTAFMGLALATTWRSQGANPFDNVQSFVTVFSLLTFVGVAIPGFVCVLAWQLRLFLVNLDDLNEAAGAAAATREILGPAMTWVVGRVPTPVCLASS